MRALRRVLDGGKPPFEIGHDVLRVFEPDGEAKEAVVDPQGGALPSVERTVRRGRWMGDRRRDAAKAQDKFDAFKGGEEALSRGALGCDLKRDD